MIPVRDAVTLSIQIQNDLFRKGQNGLSFLLVICFDVFDQQTLFILRIPPFFTLHKAHFFVHYQRRGSPSKADYVNLTGDVSWQHGFTMNIKSSIKS